MGMNSYLLEAARRPDCLYALLPHNGGSVISPLRQDSGVYPAKNAGNEGSWAERNGLIELKNILYQDNTFSSLDESSIAKINTPLNLQGNTSSKTFIGKFKIVQSGQEKLSLHAFFSQGYFPGSATLQVFSIILWDDEPTKYFKLLIAFDAGNKLSATSIVDVDFFNKEHIIALVCDIDAEQNITVAYLYCDQKMLVRVSSNSAVKWSTKPVSPYNTYPLAIRSDVDLRYLCNDKLYWAMIFDSALTAEEIAMFK